VHKVAEFGTLSPDVRVEGIGRAALTRVREQARVQMRGRRAGQLVYELVPDVESGHGLSRLPLPSPGDLFVDLEGDSFALGEGIDYLFGVAERATDASGAPRYTALWALDHASERASFERLMALIAERRAEHPDMHVYHYAPYEPTAFKRLAGRYATCVEALDDLLRTCWSIYSASCDKGSARRLRATRSSASSPSTALRATCPCRWPTAI
jgi:predicted RecB family nuclease